MKESFRLETSYDIVASVLPAFADRVQSGTPLIFARKNSTSSRHISKFSSFLIIFQTSPWTINQSCFYNSKVHSS
jgi:hypothetical protein